MLYDVAQPRVSLAGFPRVSEMTYYDLRKNWRKVKRHLDNPRVAETLVRDFNKFTYGRWRERFTAGHCPFEFESCDWWLDHRGRRPKFWNYVKYAACHWLVNFALELAQLVEPKRKWRIISSDKHSTVWNGENTLFDFNFLAFGISPQECFTMAYEREEDQGQHIELAYALHYTAEDDPDAPINRVTRDCPLSNATTKGAGGCTLTKQEITERPNRDPQTARKPACTPGFLAKSITCSGKIIAIDPSLPNSSRTTLQ